MKRKTISISEEAYTALSAVKDQLGIAKGKKITWSQFMLSIGDIGQRSSKLQPMTSEWIQGVAKRYDATQQCVEEVIWRTVRGHSSCRINREAGISWRTVVRVVKELYALDEKKFGHVFFAVYVTKSPEVAAAYQKLVEDTGTPAEKGAPEPQATIPARRLSGPLCEDFDWSQLPKPVRPAKEPE